MTASSMAAVGADAEAAGGTQIDRDNAELHRPNEPVRPRAATQRVERDLPPRGVTENPQTANTRAPTTNTRAVLHSTVRKSQQTRADVAQPVEQRFRGPARVRSRRARITRKSART